MARIEIQLGHFVRRSALVIVALLPASFAQAQNVGLSSVGSRLLDNENLGSFAPDTLDRFGTALAVGDFNGDGVQDLATGMPFDDGFVDTPVADCGTVVVRYGSRGVGLEPGLATTVLGDMIGGSAFPAHPDDHFGAALAAGDFNGDGIDDLAIGIPGFEWPGTTYVRGGVEIHYGLPQGIQAVGEHFLWPGTPGWVAASSFSQHMGKSLASGDFNGDGYDDLAIGDPGAYSGNSIYGGATYVLNGHFGGFLPIDGYEIAQGVSGIAGVPSDEDDFGASLATGDFNGDGYDDLAIGVPGEGTFGAVAEINGSQFGLLFITNILFDETGIGGSSAQDDLFGSALATGDFDGDHFDDLAIGIPLKDLGVGPTYDTGKIDVVYGSAGGFARSQGWAQSDLVGGTAELANDKFGFALAAGDFDDDGFADLVIGQPTDTSAPAGGYVTVMMGRASDGLSPSRARSFAAGEEGVPGASPQHTTGFGSALAAGDFNSDGSSDLAVGIPYWNSATAADAGAAVVLYGAQFADGFDTGLGKFIWSTHNP